MSEAEEKKYYSEEEVLEMFNSGFLRIVQAICNRKKEEENADDNYVGFEVNLNFRFPAIDEELKLNNVQLVDFIARPLTLKPKEEENAELDS